MCDKQNDQSSKRGSKRSITPCMFSSFMTPLHVAAERAHNDILEVLQKHGAKVCCSYFTFAFCSVKYTNEKRSLTWVEVTLLKHNLSWLQVNAADTLGQTALHRAALAGHIQTCKLLLSYGADPSIVSLQGFTAAQMGNEAVQQILTGKCIKQRSYLVKVQMQVFSFNYRICSVNKAYVWCITAFSCI